MLKILGCCLLWALGGLSPVWAQSNLFLGWHIQAASGYQTVTPSLTNYSNPSYHTDSQTSKGMPLTLGVGYTFALSERQVLGLGYERNLLSSKPATQNFYDAGSTLRSTSSMGFDQQSQWSVTLGQRIRNGAMAYGKLGYASMNTTDATNNFSLQGWGVGVGYKTFLNPFQFVYTEFNYTKMNEKTIALGSDSFKASAVGKGGLVGVGWQF